MMKQNMVLAI